MFESLKLTTSTPVKPNPFEDLNPDDFAANDPETEVAASPSPNLGRMINLAPPNLTPIQERHLALAHNPSAPNTNQSPVPNGAPNAVQNPTPNAVLNPAHNPAPNAVPNPAPNPIPSQVPFPIPNAIRNQTRKRITAAANNVSTFLCVCNFKLKRFCFCKYYVFFFALAISC